MFSPLRDSAQLAASPLGAAGTPAISPHSRDRGAAPHVVQAPFAGWRASVRRALNVTVAFTTLESYTADDLLRPLAGPADDLLRPLAGPADDLLRPLAGPADDLLRPFAGSADAARAANASLDAPRAVDAPHAVDAPLLDPWRTADGPRRRPAPSRARRAHATTPAEQHCTTPLPGGPRTPRAMPSSRHTPATVAARAAAQAPGAAGGRRPWTRSDPSPAAARRLG